MQTPPGEKVNPKQKQFLEEIQDVCERYQYMMIPKLQITSQGIVPTLQILDKVPEKKPVEKAVKNKKK